MGMAPPRGKKKCGYPARPVILIFPVILAHFNWQHLKRVYRSHLWISTIEILISALRELISMVLKVWSPASSISITWPSADPLNQKCWGGAQHLCWRHWCVLKSEHHWLRWNKPPATLQLNPQTLLISISLFLPRWAANTIFTPSGHIVLSQALQPILENRCSSEYSHHVGA